MSFSDEAYSRSVEGSAHRTPSILDLAAEKCGIRVLFVNWVICRFRFFATRELPAVAGEVPLMKSLGQARPRATETPRQ